jgi:hypothetical protein
MPTDQGKDELKIPSMTILTIHYVLILRSGIVILLIRSGGIFRIKALKINTFNVRLKAMYIHKKTKTFFGTYVLNVLFYILLKKSSLVNANEIK